MAQRSWVSRRRPASATIDVKGYALGSAITNRTATPAISNKGDGEFGADLKWGVTQNYLADFTYNTDFAQVEDDEQQVNLTRFSLLFPEKREFFVEGSQFFTFGTQGGNSGNAELPTLFFSRSIGLQDGGTVPIVGGARLMGKSGRYRIGLLEMRTGDVPAIHAVATDFSVIRIQRDVLRRSRIGVMGTRRAPSSTGAARQFMAAACTRSDGAAGSSCRRRSTLSRRSRGTRSMGHGARAPTTLSATG